MHDICNEFELKIYIRAEKSAWFWKRFPKPGTFFEKICIYVGESKRMTIYRVNNKKF